MSGHLLRGTPLDDGDDRGAVAPYGNPTQVGVEDGRMDITLPRHRLGIPESGGDHVHRVPDVALGAGDRRPRRKPGERAGGDHRASPRAEVFCGEIVSAYFAE